MPTMSDLRTFEQIKDDDVEAVGGKGLSLGRMSARACLCRRASASPPLPIAACAGNLLNDPALVEQIGGLSATRRRAGRGAFLGDGGGRRRHQLRRAAGDPPRRQGEAGVRDAVARCWESLDSERAVAYRREQGVRRGRPGDGRRRPAAHSGRGRRRPVHPRSARPRGQTACSSRRRGDWARRRFRPGHAGSLPPRPRNGGVVDRHIAAKTVQVTPDGDKRCRPRSRPACLDAAQLAELAELGRRVEAFYGEPRDVEWAWAEGRFWLLQARPITAGRRRRARAGAAGRDRGAGGPAEPGGTVWSRFNLPEVLPEPTPMTWAIVSASCPAAAVRADVSRSGFRTRPALAEEGVYRSGRRPAVLQPQPRGALTPRCAACASLRRPEGRPAQLCRIRSRSRTEPRGLALVFPLPLPFIRSSAAAALAGTWSSTFADPLP